MKMHLKMSSAKWRPFCPGKDELREGKLSLECRQHSNDVYEHTHIMVNTHSMVSFSAKWSFRSQKRFLVDTMMSWYKLKGYSGSTRVFKKHASNEECLTPSKLYILNTFPLKLKNNYMEWKCPTKWKYTDYHILKLDIIVQLYFLGK